MTDSEKLEQSCKEFLDALDAMPLTDAERAERRIHSPLSFSPDRLKEMEEYLRTLYDFLVDCEFDVLAVYIRDKYPDAGIVQQAKELVKTRTVCRGAFPVWGEVLFAGDYDFNKISVELNRQHTLRHQE